MTVKDEKELQNRRCAAISAAVAALPAGEKDRMLCVIAERLFAQGLDAEVNGADFVECVSQIVACVAPPQDRIGACPSCGGDGIVAADGDEGRPCPTCGGQGVVR